jgi:hypothetical protein
MAHFAKLTSDNVVLAVIVVANDDAPDEQTGIEWLTNWSGGYPYWKQTSYNATIRKNYAGINYTYDPVRDAFIPPKPYPSWVLDEETCHWTAPVPYLDDGNKYLWNESTLTWEAV